MDRLEARNQRSDLKIRKSHITITAATAITTIIIVSSSRSMCIHSRILKYTVI